MKKFFHLRGITKNDSEVLLDWRNDSVTRKSFHSSNMVEVSEHKEYLEDTITRSDRSQFIMEFNGIPVATIREDRIEEGEFELSYTVSPNHRGKKIGRIMMELYLIDRSGTFLCEVKEENISSIRMIEKCGFRFFKKENGVCSYKLEIS